MTRARRVVMSVVLAAVAATSVSAAPPPRAVVTGGVVRIGDTAMFGASATALAGDGRWFAYATADTIHVRDLTTFAELLAVHRGGCGYTALVGAPDGASLLVSCGDAPGQVIDVPSGKVRRTLPPHAEAAGYSADSRFVFASYDKTATVVALDGADEKHVALGDQSRGLAVAPGGGTLVVASWPPKIQLLDVATGTARLLPGTSIAAAAYTRDGKRIGGVSHEGRAMEWDAATGAQRFDREVRYTELGACAFGPDGTLYTLSEHDEIVALDASGKQTAAYATPGTVSGGTERWAFRGHEMLALADVGGRNPAVTGWDLTTGAVLPLPGPVSAGTLAWLGSDLLGIVGTNGSLDRLRVPSGERIDVTRLTDFGQVQLAAPPAAQAAWVATRKAAKLRDIDEMKPAGPTYVISRGGNLIQVGASAPRALDVPAFSDFHPSPDGKWLVVNAADDTVLYALPSLKRVASLGGVRYAAVWAASGAAFASYDGADGSAHATVWRMAAPQTPIHLTAPFLFHEMALDPAGTHLAVGAVDGPVAVFDLASGRLTQTLQPSPRAVAIQSLAYAPDGKWLAVLTDDRTLALVPR